MRVAVLGGAAFVLFAIIFFRLWFLQVLTGDEYVSQARENRVRKVKIEAPRGNIVDRNGRVLVKTRAAPVVQILPNSVPEDEPAAADAYRTALAAAEGRRLQAADDLQALERGSRNGKRRKPTKAQKAERRRLRKASSRAERVAIPPIAAGRSSCAPCTGGSAA